MTEPVNDPVEMIVSYKHGRSMPLIMNWKNHSYRFTKLGFWHTVHDGHKLLHIFNVADETMSYRLEFDSRSLNWMLKEVTDGLPG